MPYAPEHPELPRFMQSQLAFAAAIRDPQHAAAPEDVPPRRMALYQELFYNNVQDFLANAFPVVRQIHDAASWHALVRDFFARHRAHTPLFHEVPREFLHYLQGERGEREFPFLLELAHYEWIELELLSAEEHPLPYHRAGDLLEGRPLPSSLMRLLSYRYPVHRIGPDMLPAAPGEEATHLLVYRDSSDAVGFIELNAVSARLLQLLTEQAAASGRELLEQIAAELHHPNLQTVIEGGRETLHELHRRGIILGTRSEGE